MTPYKIEVQLYFEFPGTRTVLLYQVFANSSTSYFVSRNILVLRVHIHSKYDICTAVPGYISVYERTSTSYEYLV